jgi:hypothetical protein
MGEFVRKGFLSQALGPGQQLERNQNYDALAMIFKAAVS